MISSPRIGAVLAALLVSFSGHAENVYQQPADFIATSFAAAEPTLGKFWVNDELRARAKTILGREPNTLRIRYWQSGTRTAWILNEIGKDLPITTGVVVNNGVIETVKVLIFRESRGWEVRYPFFTDQFNGTHLNDRSELNRHIDNISGATLSVNALRKQARLALVYAEFVNESEHE